jgi:hypothetical protein
MNILYFSDDYAKNVCGTKISIYNEMIKRGHNVIWQDKKFISNKVRYDTVRNYLLKSINEHNTDQIWLAHSGLTLPYDLKSLINIPVIGFGFSDPYYFNHNDRFPSYDIYITNSIDIFNKYKKIKPMIYNPTACDFNFHRLPSGHVNKRNFVSVISRGKHPRFTNKNMRVDVCKFLILNDIDLRIYGKDWGDLISNSFVEGDLFLKAIHESCIGLDIQDTFSPLAHRMFEYSACETSVITRDRDEVKIHFEEDKEILFYNTKEELLSKLKFYDKNRNLLTKIGFKAYLRCLKEHDIKYRINHIIKELKKFE